MTSPVSPIRPEGAQAARLKGRSVGVVHLEIESVVGDQGEEDVAGVDADAAEHAAVANVGPHPSELFEDVGAKRVTHGAARWTNGRTMSR
jgi:hypothetical protein